MRISRLAKRYALGLWNYAISENQERVVIEELQVATENIEQNKQFQLFLKSPIIETSKKIEISKEIFKSFTKTFQHFIILVLKHKRENILLDIFRETLKLNDEYLGTQRVEIVSAISLEEETIAKILKSTPKINFEKSIVKNIVDESLLGGYILRMEDFQVDASVKTKLFNIKKKLSEKVY
ncbi:ATP synthase F1 subunit delta [Apibacter muscae]|uniref:ATP synthase subunit delta n=1 Tax=Apibacter muscae TaxID=2509004 RepID=A0A563DB45_9FLAO|nr:ATP synthase F1 subunit delta [Apibacter muscae]TWP27430.1 ATP synthase F1 subunit delta [Apibacter muscae]TWP28846.1 ATP synthase F1 subunit delta [Apibacter muscae]